MVIRSLEVTVISAEGLRDLGHINTMDPFAIVSLCGREEQRTRVHWKGGTTPRWVYSVAFPLNETAALAGNLFLVFEIWTKKKFRRDDQEVATAEVSVRELFEMRGDGNPPAMSYKVGLRPQGDLEFLYNFSDALPPSPQPADQERPRRISGRWVMSILPCVGHIAATAVNAADG